jgi:hypothetical protein
MRERAVRRREARSPRACASPRPGGGEPFIPNGLPNDAPELVQSSKRAQAKAAIDKTGRCCKPTKVNRA